MSDDPQRPSSSRIAWEVVIYAALFVLIGGGFVWARYLREGPRILQVDPRRAR